MDDFQPKRAYKARAYNEKTAKWHQMVSSSLALLNYIFSNCWTNERTDGRKISLFYRTSSPTGAAAPKKTTKMTQTTKTAQMTQNTIHIRSKKVRKTNNKTDRNDLPHPTYQYQRLTSSS